MKRNRDQAKPDNGNGANNVSNSSFPVIVIGRQFGSGGRRIGKLIAEKLGYTYYDSELLNRAAERLGFKKELFNSHEERKPSYLRGVLQGAFGIADNFHANSFGSERLYGEQTRLIKELAEEGPCVIVGRTADYILRDHPQRLSVFLHSPLQYRAGHILARGDAPDMESALELARKKDRNREKYYNYFTGGSNWGKAHNYEIALDSSKADPEEIAEIIIEYAKKRNQKCGLSPDKQ